METDIGQHGFHEIQISEGPYIFHGFLGLIIEIYDDKEDYLFRLIKTQKFDHKNLYTSEEKWWKRNQLGSIQKAYAGFL